MMIGIIILSMVLSQRWWINYLLLQLYLDILHRYEADNNLQCRYGPFPGTFLVFIHLFFLFIYLFFIYFYFIFFIIIIIFLWWERVNFAPVICIPGFLGPGIS